MALSKLQSVVILVICSLLVTSQSRDNKNDEHRSDCVYKGPCIMNAGVGVDRLTSDQRPLAHAKSELTAIFVVVKRLIFSHQILTIYNFLD
uniref:Uncharacterized protein n=1 Tax=Brassica oleracea TaxID=3712 RepID=A0A3P6BYZ6_BRAOL|nr:unnamed protein product [Brassica oleracea]